jgi:hypothetical protein
MLVWPLQLYLVVRELQAYANPGILYDLFLNLAKVQNLKGRRDTT